MFTYPAFATKSCCSPIIELVISVKASTSACISSSSVMVLIFAFAASASRSHLDWNSDSVNLSSPSASIFAHISSLKSSRAASSTTQHSFSTFSTLPSRPVITYVIGYAPTVSLSTADVSIVTDSITLPSNETVGTGMSEPTCISMSSRFLT